MRVRVLGPVELRSGPDDEWHRPPPQQRLVLAALVAPVGHARSLSALTEALWGTDLPDRAHRLLQVLVSRLRSTLGQGVDETGPLRSIEDGWRLDLPPEELDTIRFEQALERARSLSGNRDLDAARVAVDEALALWRGRPFGDLADESIVVAEASRLEERRIEALQLRMQLQLAAGAYSEVIAELKELLADHPLREPLWGLLMLALYRAGRQAEALVAFQRVRDRLVDELGVEPGPALQRLHGQILRHELDDQPGSGTVDVASQPTTSHKNRRSLPRPLTSFVGRQTELAAVGQLLDTHPLVTVVGPGGVGKTRLALATAAAAAPEFDLGVSFVDLSRVSPDLLVKAVASAVGVVESAQQPLLETLGDHLRRGGSLIVLDNCEQLLEPVAELAGHLLAACPDLVVLATSRVRLGLAGEQVFTVQPLSVRVPVDLPAPHGGEGSVDLSDAARLFLERTRTNASTFTAPPSLLEDVCRRLDGLPLTIELAAARAASLGIDGLLAGLDDRLRLLHRAGGGTGRHRSLRAVLDWSHDLLDEQEKQAFRRLAVFTGGFDLAAATAVVGPVGELDTAATGRLPTSEAADLVGRLADQSLLSHAQGLRGSRWTWLATVRDYAVASLEASGEAATYRRRHLRWAVATALELVDRMNAGDDWRGPFREVEDDLRSALSSVTGSSGQAVRDDGATSGQDRDRLALAFGVAELQSQMGSYTVAQKAYETAIGLARTVGDQRDLALAALGASVSGMTFGVSDRTRVAWLEESVAAQGTEPGALRVRLLARLAMELYWSVDRQRSLDLADEAIAIAEQVDDDAAHAHALYARHYTSRGPETSDERLRLSAEIVERAERAGASQLALAGRAARVVDLLAAGDLTGTDAALGMLWESADRLQQPAFQWYTDVYRLVRALLEGQFDDADALAATSIAAGRNVAEFTVGLYFAEAITDLRDLDATARRHRAVRLEDLGRQFPGVLVWRCLALLNDLALLHPGSRSVFSAPLPPARHDGVGLVRVATHELVTAVLAEPRDAHWLVEACLLAEAVAELGEATLAAQLERALRPHAGRLAVAGRVGACRGAVAHALGLLCLVLEDVDQAVRDLQDAVALHDRIGAVPYLARSLSGLAHALHVGNGPRDAALAHHVAERLDEIRRHFQLHALQGPR